MRPSNNTNITYRRPNVGNPHTSETFHQHATSYSYCCRAIFIFRSFISTANDNENEIIVHASYTCVVHEPKWICFWTEMNLLLSFYLRSHKIHAKLTEKKIYLKYFKFGLRLCFNSIAV